MTDLQQKALALKTDWSVTDAEWEWLAALTRRLHAKEVVEFGPGYSTLAFVQGGANSVISFEHDLTTRLRLQEWYQQLEQLSLPNLIVCPYDEQNLLGPTAQWKAKLGFVDGPPGHLHHYSRLVSLLYCLQNCRYVVLHDTKRDGEKRSLEVVLNLGVQVLERFDEDKGMALLERVDSSTKRC